MYHPLEGRCPVPKKSRPTRYEQVLLKTVDGLYTMAVAGNVEVDEKGRRVPLLACPAVPRPSRSIDPQLDEQAKVTALIAWPCRLLAASPFCCWIYMQLGNILL